MKTTTMLVPLDTLLRPKMQVVQKTLQTYSKEGWDVAELALMFGRSRQWTRQLVTNKGRRFFCCGCGEPAVKKNAFCVRCDRDEEPVKDLMVVGDVVEQLEGEA